MYTLQLDRCICTILTRHASINQIKSHWKTSEGEKQAYICCMFVEGKSKTVFFPSDTLIYGICRDGTKNNNIRACEHLILGQFRMGARSAIYAPLSRESFQGYTRGSCLGCLSKAQAMAPFVSQCYPRSRHGIPNQQACLVQSQSGARLACNFMPVYLPNGAL